MNIYFLVEGKTEKKIYPQLLSHLLPQFKQIFHSNEVQTNNYYIFTSSGYPPVMEYIKNAATDINDCGRYSHFAVCLDADESTVKKRENEVRRELETGNIEMDAQLMIFVQKSCLETWFLGNRKVYTRNPENEIFREYCKHYNVSIKDPEAMPAYPGFSTAAQFHEDYLKRMLREKGISYTKQNPWEVAKPYYVNELKKRVEDCPGHLQSLNRFFSFCRKIEPGKQDQ